MLQELDIRAQQLGPTVGVARARHTHVTFDTQTAQSDDLLSPAELLLASFAACLLQGVEQCSRHLPFRYARAEVTVHGTTHEAPPHLTALTYTLHLWTDEPAQRVDLLHRTLQQSGIVYNTLAACARVGGTVEVHCSAQPLSV